MTVQGQQKATAEQTEYYTPVPKVITPGSANFGAPSDAIILFNGKLWLNWQEQSNCKHYKGKGCCHQQQQRILSNKFYPQ